MPARRPITHHRLHGLNLGRSRVAIRQPEVGGDDVTDVNMADVVINSR